MTEYTLQPAEAEIGENGFAVKEGWITAYNCEPETREYTHASIEQLIIGVSLPAHAFSDAPKIPKKDGYAIVRGIDGWETTPDFRGQLAYSTKTGEGVEVTSLGSIPDDMTLLEPGTIFDVWDGKKWVTDNDAQHAAVVNEAEQEKRNLLDKIEAVITPLQTAVKYDMATDEEKTRLEAWEKYFVEVSRLDPETAPNINWPNSPTI